MRFTITAGGRGGIHWCVQRMYSAALHALMWELSSKMQEGDGCAVYRCVRSSLHKIHLMADEISREPHVYQKTVDNHLGRFWLHQILSKNFCPSA
jgi:hypothetical protein